MEYFYLAIFLYLAGGLLSLAIPEKHKATFISVFSGLGMLFALIPALNVLVGNNPVSGSLYFPEPVGKVNLVIDPLSVFFIMVISVMSFIGALYSIGYIKPYLNKNKVVPSHFLFFSFLIASMLLVVTVQNILGFLIVWEIMSLSSFFLVIFENEIKEVISAGINYLITMHISILFIIIGFILLTIKSGSPDFMSFKIVLASKIPFRDLVFILLFIGFGIKAGFVPFHTWLPRAHPAAPSHISGLMSGVMIKTGIYGILRMISLMGIPSLKISYFVLMISILSALFGIIYAIAQEDLKRLLAYSSIENIGIIGIGIGIGMLGLAYNNPMVAILGFSGCVLHILNHSIFKELLFFGVGAVYSKMHSRNIEKMGGLIKALPYTATLFLIGSVAISGLPPLNGFTGEFLIYLGMLHSSEIHNPLILIVSILTIASLALVGTMALLCFTRIFSIVFLGQPRSEKAASVKECVSQPMIISMKILAVFAFLIGLFPQFAIGLVNNPVLTILQDKKLQQSVAIIPLNILTTISLVGLYFIALFILIYAVRNLLLKNKSIYSYKTWGCGYQAGTTRMQYTASSYSSSLLSFLKPFFKREFEVKKPKDIFPQKARYELHNHDIFEFYLINPVLKINKKFFEKFYWIQSGSTQQYILYGLVFLIISLVGAVGVK